MCSFVQVQYFPSLRNFWFVEIFSQKEKKKIWCRHVYIRKWCCMAYYGTGHHSFVIWHIALFFFLRWWWCFLHLALWSLYATHVSWTCLGILKVLTISIDSFLLSLYIRLWIFWNGVVVRLCGTQVWRCVPIKALYGGVASYASVTYYVVRIVAGGSWFYYIIFVMMMLL